MKNFRKTVYMIVASFTLLFSTSCNNWLMVKTEDRIMEDNLFSNADGFMVALNGVYIELLSKDLYNGTLTMSYSDIMAQYWDLQNTEHEYYEISKFIVQQKEKRITPMWEKIYSLISNINTLLEHCESDRHLLSTTQYNMFKGEALALRALLHFECYKVFGPYYPNNKDQEVMPYVTTSAIVVTPLSSGTEIWKKIKQDLTDAQNLLEISDPIIKDGILASDASSGNNEMRYRNMRLNYYAVKGIMARSALYFGEKELALTKANEVIDATQVQKEIFPFTPSKLIIMDKMQDIIFAGEIMFGAYNLKRNTDIYEKYFAPTLSVKLMLTLPLNAYNDLYEGFEDYRAKYQWVKVNNQENKEVMSLIKYGKPQEYLSINNPLNFQYYIPILRISEMHLIKAECLAESDLDGAYQALNKVRVARNVPDVIRDNNDIIYHLSREYAREFIGEGQLLWFYKRHGYEKIPYIGKGMTQGAYPTVAIDGSNLVFPLPKEEVDNRK